MLTRELISNSIPYLHKEDKVHHALQLMNDYHVAHLPVVENDSYLGIISEEQLLQSDDDDTLDELHITDGTTSVQANDHFLKAIQTAVINKLSVVPVVEEKHLLGIVTYNDLLRNASNFMSLNEPGALIVLEMDSKNYSFNEINRIVESNDAQITQLNTFTDPESGMSQITIRVSKLEVSDIIGTFQRYEYNVKYYFGEELFENELRTNYDNLMNYLKI
ncbi:CBS domain-containing protein [Flavisolibacter ginsengisoli]|jgi:CBS domain-containing protein|uniref:CBS domain-containing protein n=1 Tax=Flavisolibacter ginsengisoli DSM 18119 TaxID=1121884 RepID=A0A1M5ED84_9BACT|nr:CBS domain-containing protein [Flavisolibacter ginsengisoli]SHF77120.1 CBS domain-containing protein [Flavisolibacter ginsengisoli DSM 18119]